MTWEIYYTGLHIPEYIDNCGLDVRIHHMATIEIAFMPPKNLDQVNTYLHKKPIIIFLSKNGVHGFHSWLNDLGISLNGYSIEFMAVGDETSKAIGKFFNQPAQIPEIQNALGLIQTLQAIPKKPVILITAEETRRKLPNWLNEAGWTYCHLPVYSTTIIRNLQLNEMFKNTQNEIFAFTSPSTVLGFLKSIGTDDFKLINSRLVSIGSTTTASIEEHFGTIFLESSRRELSILTKELLAELSSRSIPQGITD